MIHISLLALAVAGLVLVHPTKFCFEIWKGRLHLLEGPWVFPCVVASQLRQPGVRSALPRGVCVPSDPQGSMDLVQGAESKLPLRGRGFWLPSEPSFCKLVSICMKSRHHLRLTTLARFMSHCLKTKNQLISPQEKCITSSLFKD